MEKTKEEIIFLIILKIYYLKKDEELVLDWHYHYIDKKIEIEEEVEKISGLFNQ